MGEADSAINVGNAKLNLFNAYQKKNFELFVEDMTDEYVEEDNIKLLLPDYSNWISTIAITSIYSTLKINTSNLNNYLRKFILMLEETFPKHYA